ncbi:MAG: histidine phosphatase family protein [Pseudomonadales bacterium]
MRLDCLRHGLTIGNTKGIYEGRSDGVLTEHQVLSLATVRFDVSGYDAVYCSPLGRCRDTAHALGIRAWISDTRISERDFGIFEGLSASECASRYQSEFAAFQRFDANYCIPGGESRAQHLARTIEWVREIAGIRRVLAITHGGTIDFLYRAATGISPHGGERIFSGSAASVSSFDLNWPKVELLRYDDPVVA